MDKLKRIWKGPFSVRRKCPLNDGMVGKEKMCDIDSVPCDAVFLVDDKCWDKSMMSGVVIENDETRDSYCLGQRGKNKTMMDQCVERSVHNDKGYQLFDAPNKSDPYHRNFTDDENLTSQTSIDRRNILDIDRIDKPPNRTSEGVRKNSSTDKVRRCSSPGTTTCVAIKESDGVTQRQSSGPTRQSLETKEKRRIFSKVNKLLFWLRLNLM